MLPREPSQAASKRSAQHRNPSPRGVSTLLKRQPPFPRKQISPPRHPANLFPRCILIYSPGRQQAHRLLAAAQKSLASFFLPLPSLRPKPSAGGEQEGVEFGVGCVILFILFIVTSISLCTHSPLNATDRRVAGRRVASLAKVWGYK